MRKIIFGLLMCVIVNVNAQQPAPQEQGSQQPQNPRLQRQQPPSVSPEDRADRMMTRLTQDLSLTPEQQAKVRPIIVKREQDKDANRKKMDALREENKKIIDSSDADIKKLLTPEQAAKMGNHSGMPPMPTPPNGDKGAPPMPPPAKPDAPVPPAPQPK